jgi:uncharacterized protein (TIGR02996 family)
VTDESELLKAVLAAPDDDAPRLIYADWLDEHGRPERAEFVRVQCALARLPKPPASTRLIEDGWEPRLGHPSLKEEQAAEHCRALCRRERELLTGHAPCWLAAPGLKVTGCLVPKDGSPPSCWWQLPGGQISAAFRRGFVESVMTTAALWLTHADVVMAAQPVREVTLQTWPEMVHAAACPDRTQHLYRLAGRKHAEWFWFSTVDWSIRPAHRERFVFPPYQPGSTLGNVVAQELLAAEWPGVRFTLPGDARPLAEYRAAAAR